MKGAIFPRNVSAILLDHFTINYGAVLLCCWPVIKNTPNQAESAVDGNSREWGLIEYNFPEGERERL